jgi:hypothetical protein
MGSNVWKIRPSMFFGKYFFDKKDLELALKYNISTKKQ